MPSEPERLRLARTDPDLVGLFIAPPGTCRGDLMVTGGVASVVYGDPRLTRDVDLVVELDSGSVDGFTEAISSGDFYLPQKDALLEEVLESEGATSTSSTGTRPFEPTSISRGMIPSMPGR